MTKSKTDVEAVVPRITKAGLILDLLRRDARRTRRCKDWLPHTIRAALTGLRKKGHVLDKSTRGNTTCYCIIAA